MAWWRSVKGLPDFAGLKVTGSARAKEQFPDLNLVAIDRRADLVRFDEFGVLGDGGNSGFHALNLAAHFGADQIALIGFDMTNANGVHWHGRHAPGLNNPREKHFERWRAAFEASAPVLESAGIAVFNCCDHSRLTCFPHRTLEDFLA